MPRELNPKAWPFTMGFAVLALSLAASLAWGEYRLCAWGRTIPGRFLGRWSSGRAAMPCHYSYDVDGRTYEVGGSCGAGDPPTIDVVPGDPRASRLHKDVGNDSGLATLFAFFGTGMVVVALVERSQLARE